MFSYLNSHNLELETHDDPRFLKTLDKICIFLGFNSLNAFVTKVKDEDLYNESVFGKEFTTDIIYNIARLILSF